MMRQSTGQAFVKFGQSVGKMSVKFGRSVGQTSVTRCSQQIDKPDAKPLAQWWCPGTMQ